MKKIIVYYQGQHTNISYKIKITAFKETVLTYNSSQEEHRF